MKKFRVLMTLAVCGLCFGLLATQALAQSKPKTGEVLKISTREAVASFGVPLNLRGFARIPAALALDRMIQRSETPGSYEGVLAESFELAKDLSSYTFKLRKGLKFHDGSPLNAQAVKWNWDKLLAVSAERGIFKQVKSFEIIDDLTIRANLSDWTAVMMEDFRHEAAYIISPTAYEKNGEEWANQHPVGAGPWILKEYVPRQKYIYERNPDYWNKPYPYMAGLEMVVIANSMTAMASFLKGEVDSLTEVDMQTASELVSKGYKALPPVVAGTYCFYGNSADPNAFYSNIKVRQALEYAIDKKKIGDALGRGFWTPCYEVLRNAHDTGDPGTVPRKYDLAKAKQLMAEAGFKGPIKAKMIVLDKFNGDHVVAVQQALAELGIELEIEVQTGPMFQETRFKPRGPNELIWGRARGREGLGIIFYADSDYKSDVINYPAVKRPPGFDDLLNKAMKEPDYSKALPSLMQMEKLMYDDVFLVPLWNVPDLDFFTPDLKWDTNVRKSIFFTQGDRQYHYEMGWLDR